MGQRTKGGMYCDYCQRPVMGVKTTHRLRNAASVGGVVATGGLSLAGSKVEGYVCPTCGNRVHAKTSGNGLLALIGLVGLSLTVAAWLVVAVAASLGTGIVLLARFALRRKERTAFEIAMRTSVMTVSGWVRWSASLLSKASEA